MRQLEINPGSHSFVYWAPFRDGPCREKYTWRDWLKFYASFNSIPYHWYVEIGPFFFGQEKFE